MNAASLGYSFDASRSVNPLQSLAVTSNWPLQAALLLSALLHACALGWLPGLERMTSEAPLPLRILLPPLLPAPVPMDSVAVPPASLPMPHKRPAGPATVFAPMAPQTIAFPTRADEMSPARVASAVERPASVTPVEVPASNRVPTATAVVDTQALADYGRSVAGSVAIHQRYPKIAQMRQWQGTTTLQLEFAADGRLVETRVLSSSGHDVLDRQALDMLRAAQPLPPLPPALAGRALTVNVPVVFRLAG